MMARLLVANHGDQATAVVKELESRFRARGQTDMAAAYERIRAVLSTEAPPSGDEIQT